MSMRTISQIVVFLFVSGFCALGSYAYAAEVSFRVVPNTTTGDTATIIEAYIDPHGEDLNALEGIVHIQDADTVGVSSVIVETGGSLLTLWPVAPVYSDKDQAVRFTGGKPEGFHEPGLLFRMRIFSKKEGTITLSWIGGSAYRNDGLGTVTGISSRSLTTTLSRGEPNLINPSSVDTEPPRFDTILVSQDPDVYDGKYFVSFHASDAGSGVTRYTVVENQITTEALDGVYVLQDQERKSRVVITAYDHAGNSVSVKVPTKYAFLSKIILIVLLVISGLVFLYIRQKPLFHRKK